MADTSAADGANDDDDDGGAGRSSGRVGEACVGCAETDCRMTDCDTTTHSIVPHTDSFAIEHAEQSEDPHLARLSTSTSATCRSSQSIMHARWSCVVQKWAPQHSRRHSTIPRDERAAR